MARDQVPGHVLYGRGEARVRRGGARRSPADGLQPLARRAPAGARTGAVARSVQLPARGEAALEPRGLAVRIRVLAAAGGARGRARRGTCSSCSASSARAASRRSGSGRSARLAGPRSPAGSPSRSRPTCRRSGAPAICWRGWRCCCRCRCTGRAGEEGIGLVARARRRGARLDAALGPAAPRAGGDPVLRRLRARPVAVGRSAGRARARRRAARRTRSPCAGTTGASGRRSTRSSTTRRACRASSRATRKCSKQIVYLGWTVLVLAIAGLVALVLRRRWGMALVLGLGALVPILFALGANLPGYELLWRHLPGSSTRACRSG